MTQIDSMNPEVPARLPGVSGIDVNYHGVPGIPGDPRPSTVRRPGDDDVARLERSIADPIGSVPPDAQGANDGERFLVIMQGRLYGETRYTESMLHPVQIVQDSGHEEDTVDSLSPYALTLAVRGSLPRFQHVCQPAHHALARIGLYGGMLMPIPCHRLALSQTSRQVDNCLSHPGTHRTVAPFQDGGGIRDSSKVAGVPAWT